MLTGYASSRKMTEVMTGQWRKGPSTLYCNSRSSQETGIQLGLFPHKTRTRIFQDGSFAINEFLTSFFFSFYEVLKIELNLRNPLLRRFLFKNSKRIDQLKIRICRYCHYYFINFVYYVLTIK